MFKIQHFLNRRGLRFFMLTGYQTSAQDSKWTSEEVQNGDSQLKLKLALKRRQTAKRFRDEWNTDVKFPIFWHDRQVFFHSALAESPCDFKPLINEALVLCWPPCLHVAGEALQEPLLPDKFWPWWFPSCQCGRQSFPQRPLPNCLFSSVVLCNRVLSSLQFFL